jgi:hypothetical protein
VLYIVGAPVKTGAPTIYLWNLIELKPAKTAIYLSFHSYAKISNRPYSICNSLAKVLTRRPDSSIVDYICST